ncbi:ABC transporter substrate-binding protein [Clostridium sp. DL1XJH146]
MKSKKMLAIILGTMMIMTLTTGCGNNSNNGASGSGTGEEVVEEIKIGAVLPLTGPLAAIGQTAKNGVDLAVKEFNEKGGVLDKQISVAYEDDENKPANSASVTQKLINNDKVIGIVGALTSPCSLADGPVASDNKIPIISPYATNAKVTVEGGDYVFRACFIDPFQGVVISKFATEELGAKKAAVLYNVSNDYAKGLAEVFIEEFANMGGEIVGVETFNEGDQDFNAQLTMLKALDADVLFLPNMYNSVGLIAKQAKALGYDVPLLGGDGWDSPDLFEIGGDAIDGSYFSTHFSPDDTAENVATFVEAYKEAYGEIPDVSATLSYDAAVILLTAIEEAGTTDTEKIKDAIQAIEIQVVSGNVKYDENGDPIKEAVIMKVENGKQEFVTKVEP